MNDGNGEELMRDAAMFAAGAHAGQEYGSEGQSYYYHLTKTVDVLGNFNQTERVVPPYLYAAAWLHDTIEDTGVDYNYLARFFGTKVATIVEAVTDRAGRNRKERHAATYPLIRNLGGDDAVLVKLADRIANVEYSIATGDKGKMKMYEKEWPEFQNLIGRINATTNIEVQAWAQLARLMERT